jgi:glycine cleavage system H lipoate-binding protein
MTALAADRKVTYTAGSGRERVGKIAGGAKIFKGSTVAKNAAGFLVVASDTLGLRVVGISQVQVDNTAGADGALECTYLTAISAKYVNDGTSPVAQAQLGGVVYVKDDQTVQASSSKGVVLGIAESMELDGTVVVYVAGEVTVGTEELAAQVETVTTATALSAFARLSMLQPTGTMPMTLPPGRYIGQQKTLRQTGGAATPVSNVAGNYNTDGVATTSAQFNANADQLDVIWNGTAWQVINNASVTLS